MNYEDYEREERRRAYDRQFQALRDLGLDAAALIAVTHPDVARLADELRGGAEALEPRYAATAPSLRGIALARMLAVVASLFELGERLARAPHEPGAEEDLTHHFLELMPQIRRRAKFLSDEIAAYALHLVQGGGADEGAAAAFRRNCWAADQASADHRLAQALHDRDAAYAAFRSLPPHVPRAPPLRGYGAGPPAGGSAPGARAFDPALDGWGLGEFPIDAGDAREFEEPPDLDPEFEGPLDFDPGEAPDLGSDFGFELEGGFEGGLEGELDLGLEGELGLELEGELDLEPEETPDLEAENGSGSAARRAGPPGKAGSSH